MLVFKNICTLMKVVPYIYIYIKYWKPLFSLESIQDSSMWVCIPVPIWMIYMNELKIIWSVKLSFTLMISDSYLIKPYT